MAQKQPNNALHLPLDSVHRALPLQAVCVKCRYA